MQGKKDQMMSIFKRFLGFTLKHEGKKDANSESSGESAHLQSSQNLCCSLIQALLKK